MLKSLDYRAGSLSWAADQGDSPAVRDILRRCICLENVKKEYHTGRGNTSAFLTVANGKSFNGAFPLRTAEDMLRWGRIKEKAGEFPLLHSRRGNGRNYDTEYQK